MGPSCAVADVRDGKATIWSASQATHRFRATISRLLGLPHDAVRVDLSRRLGLLRNERPRRRGGRCRAAVARRRAGRCACSGRARTSSAGIPKGRRSCSRSRARWATTARSPRGAPRCGCPKATASLPNMPLLGPEAAGIAQTPGITTGLISQNGDPPYAVRAPGGRRALAQGPRRCGRRTCARRARSRTGSPSRASPTSSPPRPGAIALEFRLQGLSDPRGVEVVRRAAALIGWQARPSPATRAAPAAASRTSTTSTTRATSRWRWRSRSTRASGAIRVRRVACAHDCGLVINPDALQGADRRQHPADAVAHAVRGSCASTGRA